MEHELLEKVLRYITKTDEVWFELCQDGARYVDDNDTNSYRAFVQKIKARFEENT